MVKMIPLSKGKEAIVDDEDYEYLSQWKWYYHKGYARRKLEYKDLYMHRVINKTPNNLCTDHINGNGLDNRRFNLRTVSNQQNCFNRSKGNNRKYKGVYRRKNKFFSVITINNKNMYLGTFDNELDAIKAYNKKALELFGEFARLNIIEND